MSNEELRNRLAFLELRVASLENQLRTIADAHRMVKQTIDDESTWTIACDARDMILDEVEASCSL